MSLEIVLTNGQDIIPASNSFLKHFLDLLEKMFVYDPARRITAKEALQHPWFRERARDDGTEAARIAQETPQMMRPGPRNPVMAAA
jgi:dual-specificity kinase